MCMCFIVVDRKTIMDLNSVLREKAATIAWSVRSRPTDNELCALNEYSSR